MYKPITNIADMAGKYFQYSIGDAVALKAVEQFTKVVRVFQYSIGDATSSSTWSMSLSTVSFNTPLEMPLGGKSKTRTLQRSFQYSMGDA